MTSVGDEGHLAATASGSWVALPAVGSCRPGFTPAFVDSLAAATAVGSTSALHQDQGQSPGSMTGADKC